MIHVRVCFHEFRVVHTLLVLDIAVYFCEVMRVQRGAIESKPRAEGTSLGCCEWYIWFVSGFYLCCFPPPVHELV